MQPGQALMRIGRRSLMLGTWRCLVAAALTGAAVKSGASAEVRPAGREASLPDAARGRFAHVNGTTLHYLKMGTGPTLLLAHGWPQTSFAWHQVMPRLATRFTVVAPDMRGTGLSECAPDGYDKRSIADDLRALIAHLGVSRAHVVGHDMGGKAAYVLAHLYPQCVAKLVLVDCLVPGTENMDSLHGGAWHYGFHMAPGVPEMLTKGRELAYIRAQIRAWSHRKNAISEAAIAEYARHYAGPGRMTAGFNYYRALPEDARLVATLRGQKLPMPVMTIAGRHSVGDRLAAALRVEAPDLVSVIADDSGHFVAEEAPDFFCEHLEAFLAG